MKSLLALLLVLVAACSSEHDAGEPCDHIGQTSGECKAGLVCAKPTDDAVTVSCMPICTTDAQCASDESCNGIDGTSLKACRVKTKH